MFRNIKGALVTTIATSFFLSAQFLVPLDFITGELIDWGYHPHFFDVETKRVAFESTVFAIIIVVANFFALLAYAYAFRRTIKPHLRFFNRELIEISRYHEEQLSLIELHKAQHKSKRYKSDFDFVWIDFILTDIRKAFAELMGHKSIRVSLFVEHDQGHTGRSYMVFAQSSSFRDRAPRSTTFGPKEGYCGWAWSKGAPVCGSSKRAIFQRQSSFMYKPIEGQDENMSFLCVPLFSRTDRGNPICRGVLSIDSRDQKDFALRPNLLNAVSLPLDPLLHILTSHILDHRYILFDKRPIEIEGE